MKKSTNKPTVEEFCETYLDIQINEYQKRIIDKITPDRGRIIYSFAYRKDSIRGLARLFNQYLKGVNDGKEE